MVKIKKINQEKINCWKGILKLADNENKLKFAYSGVAVIDFRNLKEDIKEKIIKKAEKFNLISTQHKTGAILELENLKGE